MAQKYGQIYYNVIDEYDPQTIHNSLEAGKSLSDELVPINDPWIKIGIQAPPGTWCTINNSDIMIGRSGLFELDGITITSLTFKETYEYGHSDKETKAVKNIAKLQNIAARCFYSYFLKNNDDLENYYNYLSDFYTGGNQKYHFAYIDNNGEFEMALTDWYPNNENDNLDFEQWKQQKEKAGKKVETYIGQNEAENKYLIGKYGVYTILYEDDNHTIPKKKPLQNIIIDYVTKGGEN